MGIVPTRRHLKRLHQVWDHATSLFCRQALKDIDTRPVVSFQCMLLPCSQCNWSVIYHVGLVGLLHPTGSQQIPDSRHNGRELVSNLLNPASCSSIRKVHLTRSLIMFLASGTIERKPEQISWLHTPCNGREARCHGLHPACFWMLFHVPGSG